jgi:hypothetical protein
MGKFDLNRHAWIATISVAALVIFLMAGSSYLQQRSDLVTLRDEKLRAWNDAQATMRKEIELRRFMAGAGAPMTFDSAVIENQLLHLVRDWDDQTGVTNPSFQRVAQSAEHGFTRLTFQLGASGGIGPVAGLLYRVETSPIPLRVDAAQLRPTSEAGNDVEIHLTVSALCRKGAVRVPVSQVAAQNVAQEDGP